MLNFDVAVVGAGPAGLFAAHEIASRSKGKLKVVVIDQGLDVHSRKCPVQEEYSLCQRCPICHVMSGVGGAGALSSGLLNLRPDVGGDLVSLTRNEEEAWNLVSYVDSLFLKYGAPSQLHGIDLEASAELERKAAAVGIKFIPIPQRHLGSDLAPKVIQAFKESLEHMGVSFLLETHVEDVKPRKDRHELLLHSGEALTAKYVVLAPGRIGAKWMKELSRRLNIPSYPEPIDIGVRVEVPASVMEHVIRVCRDPKFHIYTDTYDDFVRTFCVNHRGFVVKEVYDDIVGVNGHSLGNKQSSNTNFALLVRIELTEPLEDTTAYGRSVAVQATTLGGGQPLLQRLGDLRMGRRSTWSRIAKSLVKPTLRSATPGDIAMAMPHRIVTDILEGLEKLDEIIPGVASSSTLLYAPEVKFSANRVEVSENLETPISNIFAAGDGAGLSRGLVTAAATGVLAGRGILEKEGLLS